MKLSTKLITMLTLVMLAGVPQACRAADQSDASIKRDAVTRNDVAAAGDDMLVDNEKVVPLSVPPLDHVDYPPDRPSWIEEHQQPAVAAADGDIVISVSSGPAATPEIATEMMQVMARGAVENYLQQQAEGLPEAISADQIDVEMDWIRDELITRQYDGTLGGGGTIRYESACLLRIDQADQRTLDQLLQNVRLQYRLVFVAVVAVTCLLALLTGSIVFGWLAARQKSK